MGLSFSDAYSLDKQKQHPYTSIHRKQYLIKYPIEMCSFWRVIFRVIGGVCNFLKSVNSMSKEKFQISIGNQYLIDDIPFGISMSIR